MAPLNGRPALADWYDRVRARSSFRTADIWESFSIVKTFKALPILAQKPGPRLAVALLAVAGIWALL